MRPTSRAHLARQLSAAITAAACKGHGLTWTSWELDHAVATTPAQAEAAAGPAMALCRDCPVLLRCAQLATVDTCTGLAAGAAYLNGVRRPTAAVVPRPQQTRRTG